MVPESKMQMFRQAQHDVIMTLVIGSWICHPDRSEARTKRKDLHYSGKKCRRSSTLNVTFALVFSPTLAKLRHYSRVDFVKHWI
jgi:hypothetical protein